MQKVYITELDSFVFVKIKEFHHKKRDFFLKGLH